MLKCCLHPCLREPMCHPADAPLRPCAGSPSLTEGAGLVPWACGRTGPGLMEKEFQMPIQCDSAREGCSGIGFLESGL